MFFKQVWRNAAKNRKGNGLFYGSLVIAIIAFYTLLSLGEQDVMRFLGTIESDAVRKLLKLLPVVYVLSLFFVFFLVYFACKYQTDNRRREFGMYLMLGMKRSRLFFMLFCETLWSSLLALLMGLPLAMFLTEGISLATAHLVGLGIIGHRFSFSLDAVIWTVCGFVMVQLLSMLMICLPMGRREPAQFLRSNASEQQVNMSRAKSSVCFVFGIVLLLIAYYLGVFRLRELQLATVAALFPAGILGTFLLYRGLGGFLGRRMRKRSRNATGLTTFTGRQVQENVLGQHKSLAVSSLLLMMAISCLSFGISLGIGRATDVRSTDFSLFGEMGKVNAVLNRAEVTEMTKAAYPVYLSWTGADIDNEELAAALITMDGGESIVEGMHCDYVISEGSYNRLLTAMGKEPLSLGEGRVALFSSMGREGDFYFLLDQAAQTGISTKINGKPYAIVPHLCYDNIVANRSITIYLGLIVPDDLFARIARDQKVYCWNLHLKDELVGEMGLMQAIQKLEGFLSTTGLEYDSYLGGMGRNLFYTVSSSYLTIYLGILFLLIANTVIGLKYLIQQRQNKHRYVTLSMLGADLEEMCRSVRRQIRTYFGLVLAELEPLTVVTDQRVLRFMLTQLLSNAMKYADETLGRVSVSVWQEGDRVVLAVRDNGSGVPPEDAPFLFDKGFTGSHPERQKATGMGLYLVKKYARSLCVEVALEPSSTSGKGFGIVLRFSL